MSIVDRPQEREWRFVLVAIDKKSMSPLPGLAEALRSMTGVSGVQVAPARN